MMATRPEIVSADAARLGSWGPADGEVMRLRLRVGRLEALLEDRDEELRRLRAAFDPDLALGRVLGLSGRPAELLACLRRRRMLSREVARAVLYGLDADRGEKVFDVHICRLRRALAPHGIEIETLFGQGWRISEAGRARLEALANEETDG